MRVVFAKFWQIRFVIHFFTSVTFLQIYFAIFALVMAKNYFKSYIWLTCCRMISQSRRNLQQLIISEVFMA